MPVRVGRPVGIRTALGLRHRLRGKGRDAEGAHPCMKPVRAASVGPCCWRHDCTRTSQAIRACPALLEHMLAHSPSSPGPTRSVAQAKPSGQEGVKRAGFACCFSLSWINAQPCGAAASRSSSPRMPRSWRDFRLGCGCTARWATPHSKNVSTLVARPVRRSATTTRMVAQCVVLATEALTPKTMIRSAKGTVDAPG